MWLWPLWKFILWWGHINNNKCMEWKYKGSWESMIQNLGIILGFSKRLFKEIGLDFFFFFFWCRVTENCLHGRIQSSFKEPESSRDMVKSRNYWFIDLTSRKWRENFTLKHRGKDFLSNFHLSMILSSMVPAISILNNRESLLVSASFGCSCCGWLQ